MPIFLLVGVAHTIPRKMRGEGRGNEIGKIMPFPFSFFHLGKMDFLC
jgi:hypothetical protein